MSWKFRLSSILRRVFRGRVTTTIPQDHPSLPHAHELRRLFQTGGFMTGPCSKKRHKETNRVWSARPFTNVCRVHSFLAIPLQVHAGRFSKPSLTNAFANSMAWDEPASKNLISCCCSSQWSWIPGQTGFRRNHWIESFFCNQTTTTTMYPKIIEVTLIPGFPLQT